MKIDHHVPIPPSAIRNDGLTDALRQCKVGDSFLLENDSPSNRTGAYVCADKLNYKITIRKTPKGRRVWRIA